MKRCLRFSLLLILLAAAIHAQTNGPLAAFAFSDGGAVGRFGAGLLFSGGPGAHVPVTGLSNAFTFESWINPSSFVWSDFWKQNPDAAGNAIYNLSLTPSGSIYFAAYQVSNGEVSAYPIFTVPTVPLNSWTHIAVTYDGAQIRIFFNAVEVGRRRATGNLLPTSQSVEIGNEFRGRIDEVRIYPRALSPSEIAFDRATPIDSLEPFQVTLYTPVDQSLGVSTTPVTATLSGAADPATVTSSTVELRDGAGVLVPAAVTYDSPSRTAQLTPVSSLAPLTDYTARVMGGTGGVIASDGSPLAGDIMWTFRTAAPSLAPRVAYSFSEGGGASATDSSGNGNTGALLHGAAWTAGMYGSGVRFDGISNDIQVPSRDTTNFSNAFTFEAWAKPTAYAWGDLWSRYPDLDGGNFLFDFAITTTGALYSAPHLGDTDYPMFTTVTLPVNVWSHVALTYDGARLRIFIEGVEVASRSAHGSLAATPEPMEIGQWFHGSIDEVRIYDRALSPAEIAVDRQTPVDASAPFVVAMVTPREGSLGVVATPVTAVFSAAVDQETLTTSTFELRDSASVPVAASVSYDPATRTAILIPMSALAPQAGYTARIASAVASAGGSRLGSDVTWSFRTAASPALPSAAYAFSEGVGTTTDDWSGNGNKASLVRGASWGSGRFGNGLSLLGGYRELLVPASESIALTNAFTFESWVNPSADGWLWSRSPDDQSRNPIYTLQTVSGGAVDFSMLLGDANFPLRTPATLPLNAWTHVAVTFDGAWIRIYLNGIESVNRTASGSLAATNEPMEIGPWFGGRLDEVRIYRRALTAPEIAADMMMPVDTRQPVLFSLTPASGSIGQLVVIAGLNVGAAQDSSTVTFNGVTASVTSWTDTSISAVVPPGASSGPVVVTKEGVPSNSLDFAIVGPRISASLSSSPNSYGWNNSNVTVTFTCTPTGPPITFCTSPQLVSWNGAGIRITGRATDQGGISATMVVTLNVDLGGPALNVYSPKSSAVFPPGTTSVRLRGGAVDVVSGLSFVTCAGLPATLAGQNFSCDATVTDGTNTVQVVATDVAGRTTTKNVSIVVGDIAPTSLTISPATMILVAGNAQPLSVTDERWRTIAGGVWSSSAPSVATVLVDAGVPWVQALTAGTATVTLTREGLSAQSTVTVFAEDATPADGTTLWSLKPTPNPQPSLTPGLREVLRAIPIPWPENSANQPPALFFVEHGPYYQGQDRTALPSVIRAATADGRELWAYTMPADPGMTGYAPVRQVVADDRGGIVLLLSSGRPVCCYQLNEAIRRIDGVTGEVSWEYVQREQTGRLSEVALHPSGYLFVVEKLSNANSTDLVMLDTVFGGERGRFDLTYGHTAYPNASNATGPMIQDDGTVIAVVSRWDNRTVFSTTPKDASLATLSGIPDSPMFTLQPLSHADFSPVDLGIGDIMSGPWPDGHGGFIIGGISSQTTSGLANVAHIGANLVISPAVNLPFGTIAPRDLQFVLGDDAAYVLAQYWEGSGQPGGTLSKLNPESLNVLGSSSQTGGPYIQLTGAIAGSGSLLTNPANGSTSTVGYGVLGGWTENAPVLQKAATPTIAETTWPSRRGATARRDSSNPRLGIFVKGQFVIAPFFHTSLRIVPKDQGRWAGQAGFHQDTFGTWYVTIGAESDTANCSGLLKSDLNRPSDLNPEILIYRERLSYATSDEEALVEGLLQADGNYLDELFYSCLPLATNDKYNSNSYTHGLLNKVGLPSPITPFILPFVHTGWKKPVPSTEFDPAP